MSDQPAPQPPVQYRIKAKDQPGPQCLWEIKRPDLGMVGTGYRWVVIRDNVVAWRKANGIPIGLDFENELENALCAKYPDACFSDDPRAPIKIERVNLSDVIHGTKVMIRHFLNKREIVPREEAERRANICATCKLNVNFPKGCGGSLCGELLEIVKSIVGAQSTSRDAELHSCYICKCFNQPAVWVPAELQVAALIDHQKEQFKQVKDYCWKAQAIP